MQIGRPVADIQPWQAGFYNTQFIFILESMKKLLLGSLALCAAVFMADAGNLAGKKIITVR